MGLERKWIGEWHINVPVAGREFYDGEEDGIGALRFDGMFISENRKETAKPDTPCIYA